jgi:hypothetical protein
MRAFLLQAGVVVLALAFGFAVGAEGPPGRAHFIIRHLQKKEGTPPPGRPRCIPNTDARAGYPRDLRDDLEPSMTPGGIGYYVGGGVPTGHRLAYDDGACRRRAEGTWGWDETGGVHRRRRVILGWSHGRRYQGGTGGYRTDGPVVPDLVYAATSTLNSLGLRERGEQHE